MNYVLSFLAGGVGGAIATWLYHAYAADKETR
jgi:hypothetical protein